MLANRKLQTFGFCVVLPSICQTWFIHPISIKWLRVDLQTSKNHNVWKVFKRVSFYIIASEASTVYFQKNRLEFSAIFGAKIQIFETFQVNFKHCGFTLAFLREVKALMSPFIRVYLCTTTTRTVFLLLWIIFFFRSITGWRPNEFVVFHSLDVVAFNATSWRH